MCLCVFSRIYRVSQKKMSFLGKIAITTLKLIQNAKVGGVLENSGYLLPNEEKMTEKMKHKVANPPSKNGQNFLLTICSPLMFLCIFMTCNESKTCSKCW